MRALLRIAPFVVLLAGCSVVNDPARHQGHVGVTPIAAADACQILTDAYCDAYMRCCDAPTMSDAMCRANGLADCQMKIEPYLVDAVTGYDPQVAGEVVAEGVARMQVCDPTIAEWYTYELLTILDGTAPRGATCLTLEQGIARQYAGVLSCQMGPGLVCRPPGDFRAWTCQGVSSEMGPCNYLAHCATGLYCTGTLARNGQCLPQLADGVACDRADRCQSLNCVMGVCQPADRTVYCADPLPNLSGDVPAG